MFKFIAISESYNHLRTLGNFGKDFFKFYDIYAKREELSKIFPMKIHKSLTLTHSGIVNYKHIEPHIIIRKSRDIYQRASERERD